MCHSTTPLPPPTMVVGNAFCILLVVGALLIRSLRGSVCQGGAYPGGGGGGYTCSQGTFSSFSLLNTI